MPAEPVASLLSKQSSSTEQSSSSRLQSEPTATRPAPTETQEDDVNDIIDNDDDTEHDTLGLLWDDEPNSGGVLPNADRSIGTVSALTTPELFPLNQIKIPGLEFDENRPGTAMVAIGGGSVCNDIVAPADELQIINFAADLNPNENEVTNEDRIDVAKKNLNAGMEACDKTAFDTAAMYFIAGKKQLGENGWDIDHDTMLKLCSEGAHASYTSGDFETMDELLNEILGKEELSIKDKFRAYEVKILAEQGLGNYHDSIALGIDVRKQLGLQTPKNKKTSVLTILMGYVKTMHGLGSRTVEELANLPELTDERIIMGQRILELMEISCYQAQPTMFALLVFLLMDTTLKYGINASSIDAFTGLGVILCGGFGKPQRGREMARVAELLLAKPGTERMKARAVFVCEGLINHWTKPLKSTLAPLLTAFRVGLECGDGQSAGICQSLYVTHTFYCGLPLEGNFAAEMVAPIVGLQNETETKESCTVVQTQQDLDIHVIYLLGSKKLRGKEVEPEEQNFDDILDVANKTGNQSLCGYIYAGHMELKVIFGEWEDARNLVERAGDVRAALVATFTGIRFTFLGALIYVKAAQLSSRLEDECPFGRIRLTDAWKWKRKALKEIRLIRKWVKRGNLNVLHSLHLLEAELAVLNGKSCKAEENFNSAIEVASKNGFLQDKALSHELASSYFKSRGDDSNRDHHMDQAIKCYRDWGAMAKVAQLTCEFNRNIQLPVVHEESSENATQMLCYPTLKKAAQPK